MEKQALEIILYAGDARLEIKKAIDAVYTDAEEECEEALKTANEKLIKAHQKQTEVIQKIASGELEEKYSILFTHAQDTLMTVYSEYNLTVQIIGIYKKLNEKLLQVQDEAKKGL